MRNEYLMKIFYPFIGNKYYLLNGTASVTMCNLTGTSAIRALFCCCLHSIVSNSTNTAWRGLRIISSPILIISCGRIYPQISPY